jgi:hypothetical protein
MSIEPRITWIWKKARYGLLAVGVGALVGVVALQTEVFYRLLTPAADQWFPPSAPGVTWLTPGQAPSSIVLDGKVSKLMSAGSADSVAEAISPPGYRALASRLAKVTLPQYPHDPGGVVWAVAMNPLNPPSPPPTPYDGPTTTSTTSYLDYYIVMVNPYTHEGYQFLKGDNGLLGFQRVLVVWQRPCSR